jgi:hypothetical protein
VSTEEKSKQRQNEGIPEPMNSRISSRNEITSRSCETCSVHASRLFAPSNREFRGWQSGLGKLRIDSCDTSIARGSATATGGSRHGNIWSGSWAGFLRAIRSEFDRIGERCKKKSLVTHYWIISEKAH